MTAQISDSIAIDGRQYSIYRSSNRSELFDPISQDIYPDISRSTACYRGFYCGYAINDNRLVLIDVNLYPNFADYLRFKYRKSEALLCGKSPILEPHRRMWQYRNLSFQLDYTGGLVIVSGSIDTELKPLYNTNFPFCLFENVFELIFESGRSIDSVDYSIQIKELRDRFAYDRADETPTPKFSIYDLDLQILEEVFQCVY